MTPARVLAGARRLAQWFAQGIITEDMVVR